MRAVSWLGRSICPVPAGILLGRLLKQMFTPVSKAGLERHLVTTVPAAVTFPPLVLGTYCSTDAEYSAVPAFPYNFVHIG